MKKVGDMKLYSFEELLEEDYGKVGTPERDAFERSVDEAVTANLPSYPLTQLWQEGFPKGKLDEVKVF